MPNIFIFSPLPLQKNGIATYGLLLHHYFSQYRKIYVIDDRQQDVYLSDDYSVIRINDFKKNYTNVQGIKLFQFGNNKYMTYLYNIFMKYGGIAEIHEELDFRYQLRLPCKYRSNEDFTLKIADRADYVIVHSYSMYYKIQSALPNVRMEQIFMPPHLVSEVTSVPEKAAALRSRYGISADGVVFCSIGFADKRKMVDEALLAFSRLPAGNHVFFVAGKGSRSMYGRWEHKAGRNRVIVEDFLSEEDFLALLYIADLVVNLRRLWVGENSGITATAMGMGRCVLVSDVGSFAELPNDTVLKIDNTWFGFVGHLRKIFENCLADRDTLRRIGHNAQRFMQKVSNREYLTERWRTILDKSCDERKRILVIATFNPFNNCGMSTSLLLQCDMLHSKGYALDFLCYYLDYKDKEAEFSLRRYFDRVRIVRPETFNPEPDADGVSLQSVDAWCSEEFVEAAEEESSRRPYVAAVAHHIWTSLILSVLPDHTTKYLFMHDNFADRAALYRKQGLDPSTAWFSVSEAEQDRGMRRADMIFAVQEEEAAYFKSRVDKPVIVIGVPFPVTGLPARERIARIGWAASDNPNNRHAFKELAAAWERNAFLNSTCELVIGGRITKFLPRRLPRGMVSVGPVRDMKDFYEIIDVAVNPDTTGTGIKIKTLEALSFGRPLVCTKIAARGLHSACKEHNADSVDEMLQYVAELVQSPEKADILKQQGTQIFNDYIKKYDYSYLFDKYESG
jgi:glycosyltransferase involved in cell wall biosynthesis